MKNARVAVYCRIANNGNVELLQRSLAKQKHDLAHYAAAKGMDIVGSYEDIGYHGRNDDRPGLRKLMEDAATGHFDTVLVYKMTRLYRQEMPDQKRPFRLISMLDGWNVPTQ